MGGPGSGRKPNSPRRRRAVELRMRGLTLAEIGRRLGMTAEGVRQTLSACGLPTCRTAVAVRCVECGREVACGNYHGDARAAVLCAECLAVHPGVPFGQRLRSCRLAAGLTREDLAARAGISASTLCAYEQDRRSPTWRAVAKLVLVCGSGVLPITNREPAADSLCSPAPESALCCRICGAIVGAGPARFVRDRPVLCLACVAPGPNTSFGQRLKACRLAAGLTLRGLAERAGLHPQNLCHYEAGAVEPMLPTLAKLLQVLGPDLVMAGLVSESREPAGPGPCPQTSAAAVTADKAG